METDVLLWRLVHFFAGAFWIGVGLFSIAFLTPVVQRTGPEGQTVMRYLVGKTRFPAIMSTAAILTVLSGVVLYWRVSGHLDLAWMGTTSGTALTLGAATGLAALIVSILVQSRSSGELSRIGRAIEASGSPPMSEQLELMRIHQRRLIRGARMTGGLLVISLASMAAWRYLYN